MQISGVNANMALDTLSKSPDLGSDKGKINFAEIMKEQVENLNHLQAVADQKTEALITGEIDNLHEVMIAAEEAEIALEMTIQVKNKVMDAYQEIMRMQI